MHNVGTAWRDFPVAHSQREESMSHWSTAAGALLRGAVTAVGVALGVTAAAAQTNSPDWGEVVSKAKNEGRINIYYVAVPQQMERLIAAFKSKYPGFVISATRGISELPQRIAAERQANNDGADVFIFYDPVWFDQNEEHLLELNSPASGAYPERGWYLKNKAAYVGFSPFGMLVWNTDYVKEPLKDYRDLLKPEFVGRVGARDGRDAVLFGYLDFLETELGSDYLKALAKQKPKFYPTGVPLNQAVAAGEVWVSNVGLPSVLQDLKEQGAPVAWAVPKPAGFANPWVGAVLKSSRRPNAARLFVDFTLTPEGQSALNGKKSSASPIAGLEDTLDLSEYRILDSKKFTPAVVDAWAKKFDEYFRK
jgi:iron(III) transport system substrate-binding protein